METIHVYPVNDTEDHITIGIKCKCKPRIERHGKSKIIIHNSFDGREGLEQANEVLSNGNKL